MLVGRAGDTCGPLLRKDHAVRPARGVPLYRMAKGGVKKKSADFLRTQCRTAGRRRRGRPLARAPDAALVPLVPLEARRLRTKAAQPIAEPSPEHKGERPAEDGLEAGGVDRRGDADALDGELVGYPAEKAGYRYEERFIAGVSGGLCALVRLYTRKQWTHET